MSQTQINPSSIIDALVKALVMIISGAVAYLVAQFAELREDAQNMAIQLARAEAKDEARDELISQLVVRIETFMQEPRFTANDFTSGIQNIEMRLNQNDEYLDRRRLWMEKTDEDLQRLESEVRLIRAQVLRSRSNYETERVNDE